MPEMRYSLQQIAEIRLKRAENAERDLAQARAELAELRPKVRAFARLMEERLRANDSKGRWAKSDKFWLVRRAQAKMEELYQETLNADIGGDHYVGDEAADVANFCMMVADVLGDLPIDSARITQAPQE